MSVLRLMPDKLKDTINDCLRKFMWDNKTLEIALDILTADKGQCGLRLVDITVIDKSLKIQWVKVYNENHEIRTVANQAMLYVNKFYWMANIDPKDAKNVWI